MPICIASRSGGPSVERKPVIGRIAPTVTVLASSALTGFALAIATIATAATVESHIPPPFSPTAFVREANRNVHPISFPLQVVYRWAQLPSGISAEEDGRKIADGGQHFRTMTPGRPS